MISEVFKGCTSGEAALFAHNEEREAFRVWVLNNYPHILSILAVTEFHILLPISVGFSQMQNALQSYSWQL